MNSSESIGEGFCMLQIFRYIPCAFGEGYHLNTQMSGIGKGPLREIALKTVPNLSRGGETDNLDKHGFR